MSAKWQRRSGTSVWRRRRSPRMQLHAWIRSVAWPWGESEELELWLILFRWLPAMSAAGGVVVALWGFGLHGLEHDEAWGAMHKRLWAEVCNAGDLEAARHGDVCPPQTLVVAAGSTLMMLPWIVFRFIKWAI